MMTLHVSNKILRVAAIAATAALAPSACGKNEDEAGQQGGATAGQQTPAPEVRVVTVYPQQVTTSTDLPGHLESFRSAGIHAQIGGIIKRRLFQGDSYVKAGQPLYQLDDATYIASLESACAQLATTEASLAKAGADLTRYKPLVAANAISKQGYDAAVTSKRSGEASVKSAKATIKSVQTSVGYSRITAPISGYIGQSEVPEDSLAGANDNTVLATIQQTNPMYINLTQSATDMMRLKQDIADGKMQVVNGAMEASILLESGAEYPHKGRLLLADPTVNGTAGQVTLRAEVPNKDNVLLPGLYVRVRLPQANIADSFVVPQQAVTRGTKDTVLIVNAEGEMEPREVTVARQQGTNWVITTGLNDGDRVVVEGTSIIAMSGAKEVTPKEWTPSGNKSTVSALQSAASFTKPAAQTASEAKPASATK